MKVTNPISKKKITIGGKIFNQVLESGYVFQNNELIPIEYVEEKQIGEDFSEDEDVESSDETGNYEYESIEDDIDEDDDKSQDEIIKKVKNINMDDSDEEYYENNNEEYYENNNEYVNQCYGGEKRPQFYKQDIEIPSYELPHVRCIECNKPISILHKKYLALRDQGVDPIEIYKELNLNRPCCRMHISQTPREYLFNVDYENDSNNDNKKPSKTLKLTKNPLINKPIENKNKTENDIVRVYKNSQFEGIKTRVRFGPNKEYVKHEDFKKPELLRKTNVAGGKYYISYAK
jgi:DNA-directed RNA polymerase subunit N (RpoN/RPB10)